MNLEELQNLVAIEGYIWKERAVTVPGGIAWLDAEVKAGRLQGKRCIYPYVECGTRPAILVHKPGFNFDLLRTRQKAAMQQTHVRK